MTDETDKTLIEDLVIPADTLCHYSVTVNSDTVQMVKLADAKGRVVFGAIGANGGAGSHQIAAGKFLSHADAGQDATYRLSFRYIDPKSGAQRWSSTRKTHSVIADAGAELFHGISVIASNDGDFTQAIDCVLQLFYLPRHAPRHPAVCDILTVVDAQAVLDAYPTPSQEAGAPTPITDGSVYLLASGSGNPLHGLDSGAITITAAPGDVVRWFGESVSANAELGAVIYGLDLDDVVLKAATAAEPSIVVPIPDEDDPVVYQDGTIKSFRWESPVAAVGTSQATIRFYITQIDGHTMTTAGYFSWNTTLTITA